MLPTCYHSVTYHHLIFDPTPFIFTPVSSSSDVPLNSIGKSILHALSISLFHFDWRSFWSLYYNFPQPEQSGIGSQQTLFILLLLYASITLPRQHLFTWFQALKAAKTSMRWSTRSNNADGNQDALLHGSPPDLPLFHWRGSTGPPPFLLFT